MKKIKDLFRRAGSWIKQKLQLIKPGENAEKGAALGVLVATAFFWILFVFLLYLAIGDAWVLLFGLVLGIVAVLGSFISRWLLNLLLSMPQLYKLALLISIPTLAVATSDWMIAVFLILLSSLAGAAVWVLKETGFAKLSMSKKAVLILGSLVCLAGLVVSIYLYSKDGFDLDPIENAAAVSSGYTLAIDAEDPSLAGPYTVKTLTYGSGKDLHRPEYGAEADLITDSVNGVPFIDNWSGFSGWYREKYWGFDARSLPLNGRVWYPEGEGPFPLALIVHGNHSMQDYSDPGYDYLGELLASRGIILVSVDENFINSSISDILGGLKRENDARGWLLLEHLKMWHEWNKTSGNPFHKKVDTTKIALLGHSRGGEAVAHAALFNRLPYYPDDASIPFDYNFDIRSVVAIAPVDGQYKSGNRSTEIENVNYLALHGSLDGDVRSFMGLQQYERTIFTDTSYYFKSALYIHGANHGQFNSTWGQSDRMNPFVGLLNLRDLMPEEDQQQIAKVYISAFLEATLKDSQQYLPLFINPKSGNDWLPETIFLSQFHDSNIRMIADFEEDFDVTTISNHRGKIETKNLTVWREEEIQLKWQAKGSRAVFVGWKYDQDSIQAVPDSAMAAYSLTQMQALTVEDALIFSVAESTENADPKSSGKWVENNAQDQANDSEPDSVKTTAKETSATENDTIKVAKKPINLSIQLTDSSGQMASVPLSTFSSLQRQIEVVIEKTGLLKGDKESEKIFQTFYLPMGEFVKANPQFDPEALRSISYVFDQSTEGVVVIDDIGVMKGFGSMIESTQ